MLKLLLNSDVNSNTHFKTEIDEKTVEKNVKICKNSKSHNEKGLKMEKSKIT